MGCWLGEVQFSKRRTVGQPGILKQAGNILPISKVYHLLVQNNGTAVGLAGSILRTTDGGTNWIPQSSGTTNELTGVFFLDANTGTAIGYNGTILKTTDGGANWAPQSSGTNKILSSIFFTDANTGTVVGQDTTILRTTNGGTSWTPISHWSNT